MVTAEGGWSYVGKPWGVFEVMCDRESTLCHPAGGRKPARVETALQKAEMAPATSLNRLVSGLLNQEVLMHCIFFKQDLVCCYLYFCLRRVNATRYKFCQSGTINLIGDTRVNAFHHNTKWNVPLVKASLCREKSSTCRLVGSVLTVCSPHDHVHLNGNS